MSVRSNRLRVVRIIDRLNVGGPAKHVTWLTAGMNSQEFDTTLITGTIPPGEGDMSYFAREAGVEPLILKEMSRELNPRDLFVIWKLWRELVRLQPHIVHTHKAKAGAAGRLAAWLYKWLTPGSLWLRPRECRVLHTFHGHIFHNYYGAAKTAAFIAIERALARFCTDRIITISNQQRREINEQFKVGRAAQFEVISLGIDFEETKSRRGPLRAELGIGDATPLIGVVGRLCEIKNHALLLESLARLKRQGLDWRLAVVGDGHLRAPLEAQANALGIAERVHFTGFRQDAAALYAEFDIAALTSLNEGTPLTLIEAMSCGVPAAATEVGGVVDLLGARREQRDGFTIWEHGVTAPSRDAESYARALKLLIEDSNLRARMGAQGRAFIHARFSKQRLIADMESLYRNLTATQSLPQAHQPFHAKLKERTK